MVAELVTRALANVQAALAGWPLGGAPAHVLKTLNDRIDGSGSLRNFLVSLSFFTNINSELWTSPSAPSARTASTPTSSEHSAWKA